MRILHVIPGLGIGGAEVFLESLISAWPRNNDEHIVVSFRGGEIAQRLRAKNIVVHELFPEKTITLFAGIAVFQKLSQIMRDVRPDVVVSSLWSANVFSRLLCWSKRLPIISVWHNNAQFLGLFKRYIDVLTAVVFPGRMVAVSASVLESYRGVPLLGRFLKKRSTVVENGVNVAALLDGKLRQGLRHKFNVTPKRFVFGAVGRLIPVKAFSNLILAFHVFLQNQSLLDASAGDVPLLCIVGEGPERQGLQALIDRLKLSAHVMLCGQQDDMAPILHDFSAYVSSSKSEGLSVALLEALAVGLPFVVTPAGETGGFFRPDVDGIVVESHEVMDLAFGLIRMYAEYDKYACNAQSRTHLVSKFFSIARTAERYATLIEAMIPE